MLEVRLRNGRGKNAIPLDLPDAPAAVRTAAGLAARDLPPGRSRVVVDGASGARFTALVEGLVLGSYRFRVGGPVDEVPTRVDLYGTDGDAELLAAALAAATATGWARDLANTRSNVKSPAWLAERARAELTGVGVDVEVRDEHWLAEQGFGGVLAVGAGSATPPRLIEASWRPRRARKGVHLVLVGKGITFDTGGINLKAGDGARTMFTDMSGGAAVLGAIRLIASLRTPVRVTALVPAAENAISGSAMRPGDVVRHVGGRTSEITNTDAEGRIVLADAIAYAAAKLKPTAIVDIATLTGAMKLSLGLRIGGLLTTSDPLAVALTAAGETVGEPLWRLPLNPDYGSSLRSEVADANNSPGNPGGITAGLFLEPFAGDVPWAHLDVAGPARAPEDEGMFAKGATGFGARLLAAWVASLGDARP